MSNDEFLYQRRVRMQLETDPEQTAELKALLTDLTQVITVVRKETKRSKIADQARFELLESKASINAYDPTQWPGLSIQDVLCIYSWKGVKFRFTIDSHAQSFMPFLELLILRLVPFKIYDILNEEEVHAA